VQQPDTAPHTRLSDKLDDVLSEYVAKHVYPELSARVRKIAAQQTKGTGLMLRKGRRLTEQTLDSCQMKRTKAPDVEAELKHLAQHMANWKVLGHDVALQEFALMALYAKHRCAH
jgi:hypothetical protein